MKKLLLTTIILLTLCSSRSGISNHLIKAQWLVGTWQMKTTQGYIYEFWGKAGKNELTGKSYMLKGKDTVIFETLQLIQQHDSLFYISTVKRQNGGLPVCFKLESLSDSGFVFNNSTHDFPQFIAYKRVGADSLIAEISGKQNGRERREQFRMLKVK